MVSPLASLTCPDWSHLVSPRPRRDILYLLISSAISAACPPAYMVLTFHVAMLVGRLEVRSSFGHAVSFRFSRHIVIISLACGAVEASLPRGKDFLGFVDVSVAMCFLRGGSAGPTPNPHQGRNDLPELRLPAQSLLAYNTGQFPGGTTRRRSRTFPPNYHP